MRVIVVVGAGEVGHSIAADLASNREVVEPELTDDEFALLETATLEDVVDRL